MVFITQRIHKTQGNNTHSLLTVTQSRCMKTVWRHRACATGFPHCKGNSASDSWWSTHTESPFYHSFVSSCSNLPAVRNEQARKRKERLLYQCISALLTEALAKICNGHICIWGYSISLCWAMDISRWLNTVTDRHRRNTPSSKPHGPALVPLG